MKNEIAILGENEIFEEELSENFDFDDFEEKLQRQLEGELEGLEFLQRERELIGNPDNLGDVIKNVVWEQFINQVAVTAGKDFIKENNNLTLDLRKKAHIQDTENFAKGKIATHNAKINFQKRYDDWQNNFQRNEDGSIRMKKDPRTGEMKPVLRRIDKKKDPNGENYNFNFNPREQFDLNRPKGSVQENIDEVISVAEQLRDPAANAHLTKDELVDFDNSEKNLNPMDSAANQSKGDSTMTEFLDSEKDGKKPAERFNIDEEALRKKDAEAREEFEKRKKEGEERSIKAGKQSQREEAFRISGKVLRAAIMNLLAELIREIISKLIKWFKESHKNIESLIKNIKEAIYSFISRMKENLIKAGETAFTTITTAIIDPITGTLSKIWMLLKQGWRSFKEAVDYIRSPENKGKPIGMLMPEVGKIIIAGLTGVSAIVLGDAIEKGLMTVPTLNIQIPLLGSLANILGIFFGAVIAGIIGAIAINIIGKKVEKNQKIGNDEKQIDKKNEVLNIQHQILDVNGIKLENHKANIGKSIKERHIEAANIMKESLENIIENCKRDESIDSKFDYINKLTKEFGEGL